MFQMGCKVSVSIVSVSLYLGLKLQLAHTQRKTQLLTTCVSISFNETALTDEHWTDTGILKKNFLWIKRRTLLYCDRDFWIMYPVMITLFLNVIISTK